MSLQHFIRRKKLQTSSMVNHLQPRHNNKYISNVQKRKFLGQNEVVVLKASSVPFSFLSPSEILITFVLDPFFVSHAPPTLYLFSIFFLSLLTSAFSINLSSSP